MQAFDQPGLDDLAALLDELMDGLQVLVHGWMNALGHAPMVPVDQSPRALAIPAPSRCANATFTSSRSNVCWMRSAPWGSSWPSMNPLARAASPASAWAATPSI